jgi:PAS domain S-box-containing protein
MSRLVVSGEIVLEKLIDMLMRTAIEHTGAERAVLMLAHGAEHRIEAEATIGDNAAIVSLPGAWAVPVEVPESVVQYAARTAEPVILDDGSAENAFSDDAYFRQHRTRSLLCLPLLHQAKHIGVLYLENNLAAHVFTGHQLPILKLLASQAAISLEYSRLYNDLEEREARIHSLVDANIIGIVFWDLDGRVIDANDAFLRMVQYDREELNAGLRWIDMTPPDWRGADAAAIEDINATGTMRPYEKEFFRKDGSRVPVLLGGVAFEGRAHQGVDFVVDLTERKQAEERVREGERRYRELQSELAHANRVATMGQLSAWIAHDVKQPLVSVVTSANAGLRWLSADPPNVEAALRSLERVVKDGHRAAEVLDRTRALVKKASPRKEPVDVNRIISETIALVEAEARQNGIFVKIDLAADLPLVSADRIQIQQVVLNLIVNAIEAMNSDTTHRRDLRVVSATDPSAGVLVAVQDSGPGLPAERRDLFDAFYTTKPEGLGMGLAICRTIIESYGGRIWATPNTPQGAVFKFVLPGVGVESMP